LELGGYTELQVWSARGSQKEDCTFVAAFVFHLIDDTPMLILPLDCE
jgi:hypothetical protein